jgi:arylsulfatase A-like enzyme
MYNTETKPHIVLIVLDTHRSDRLGCYGYRRGTSPNIDAFAQKATLYQNAIAPAQWTIPTHASIFTGEPASTHLALQSNDVLDARLRTLAERLSIAGYETIGFCNNPLVGVINNGFKRGFGRFYNYCGALPRAYRPSRASFPLLKRCSRVVHKAVQPIQDAFARSSQVFDAALNPFWVPLWTRFAHFKGNTPVSIRDAARFVARQMTAHSTRPRFLFLNLMETHLPYSPPRRFTRAFAPQIQDRAARSFMKAFNRRALDWITPPQNPFSELEAHTLSDMYDAEVAYQDHLLAELLDVLDRPEHRAHTMVVLVADHGEMLGEHALMGHGFGVYRELIHVPLLIRFPGQAAGQHVATPVSTTRLFHTILDAAGIKSCETDDTRTIDTEAQTLLRETQETPQEPPVVLSEAFAPEFALEAMERHKKGLIEKLNCRATHWAVYQQPYKLIHVPADRTELYSLEADPLEREGLLLKAEDPRIQPLIAQLSAFLEQARKHRPQDGQHKKAELENERIRRRLRGLGYIE